MARRRRHRPLHGRPLRGLSGFAETRCRARSTSSSTCGIPTLARCAVSATQVAPIVAAAMPRRLHGRTSTNHVCATPTASRAEIIDLVRGSAAALGPAATWTCPRAPATTRCTCQALPDRHDLRALPARHQPQRGRERHRAPTSPRARACSPTRWWRSPTADGRWHETGARAGRLVAILERPDRDPVAVSAGREQGDLRLCRDRACARPATAPACWRDAPGVDNVVARIGRGSPSIVFNAHVDTVGVGERASWRTDPFTAVGRDGQVFGLGAGNCKGRWRCSSGSRRSWRARRAEARRGRLHLRRRRGESRARRHGVPARGGHGDARRADPGRPDREPADRRRARRAVGAARDRGQGGACRQSRRRRQRDPAHGRLRPCIERGLGRSLAGARRRGDALDDQPRPDPRRP